jgi:hypothetical protein
MVHPAAPSEPLDRVLRNPKLQRLHEWLRSHVAAYVGLYEAGSVAAGDPWVEGRSDRDVLILVDGGMTPQLRDAIASQLETIGFTDHYLFYLGQKPGFLQTHSDHDVSMKFRGIVLFGEDVLAEKEVPSRAFVQRWADVGLRTMAAKLRIRILNARCWSIERLRDELYTDFKLMFMLLADQKYAETGVYPRTRVEVADAYDSQPLRELLRTLVEIDQADRQTLIQRATLAIGALQDLVRRNRR